MRSDLINQYEAGAEKLALAIRGLTREDLLATPIPGTWSIQQIVLHMLDSDLIATDRMKRVVAEDNPTLIGFDESRFATSLFYEEQSAEDAAKIFELNRKMFARVLRKLPEAAFDRQGTHNERGPLRLRELLETYVNHLEHHLKFIVDKREKLGKMMW